MECVGVWKRRERVPDEMVLLFERALFQRQVFLADGFQLALSIVTSTFRRRCVLIRGEEDGLHLRFFEVYRSQSRDGHQNPH